MDDRLKKGVAVQEAYFEKMQAKKKKKYLFKLSERYFKLVVSIISEILSYWHYLPSYLTILTLPLLMSYFNSTDIASMDALFTLLILPLLTSG